MTAVLGTAGGSCAARVPQPAVQLEGLRKCYGDVTAVDGVTADIDPGSVVAFLGPNGAGKTTLVEMLAGFVAPTSGRAGGGARRSAWLPRPAPWISS